MITIQSQLDEEVPGGGELPDVSEPEVSVGGETLGAKRVPEISPEGETTTTGLFKS